jgi:hypothetical protein
MSISYFVTLSPQRCRDREDLSHANVADDPRAAWSNLKDHDRGSFCRHAKIESKTFEGIVKGWSIILFHIEILYSFV